MPDTSVPPHMPQLPFNLLPRCKGSVEVGLSKSMYGHINKNCVSIPQFLPTTQSPLVFTVRNQGGLSSQYWNLGLESRVWGWNLSLLRYPSWFLSTTHSCGTSPFQVSVPPTSLEGCGFFFNSVVAELLLNSISASSEWLFFYSLVVILMQLSEEVSRVYISHHFGDLTLISFFIIFSLQKFHTMALASKLPKIIDCSAMIQTPVWSPFPGSGS